MKNKRDLELASSHSSGYSSSFLIYHKAVFDLFQTLHLCKPIQDIINYSDWKCPFQSLKLWKVRKKITKIENLQNKKSFSDEIKMMFEGLSFSEKNIYSGHKL